MELLCLFFTFDKKCFSELKDEDNLLPLTGSNSLKMHPVSRSPASGECVRGAGFSAADLVTETTSLSSACTQSFPKRHLSIASVPTVPHCLSAVPRISTKPGVASLLFHRTLSPSDALQVQSYAAKSALCKPEQSRTEKLREELKEPDIQLNVRPNTQTPQPNTEVGNCIVLVCIFQRWAFCSRVL